MYNYTSLMRGIGDNSPQWVNITSYLTLTQLLLNSHLTLT